MNIFNNLRNNGSKIDVDSPTKSGKHLSPSQQIYLQQINNYIELEGGYDVLKQKLFKTINQLYMHDSPFIQQIVILLRKGLQSRRKQLQLRTLSIIQDLTINCGKIMNQAFNDRKFCEQLYISATFLMNLKVYDRQQIRQKVAGLCTYWHNKFKEQQKYFYHTAYQGLKQANIQFPLNYSIKQPQPQIKKPQIINSQQIKNVSALVSDCQQTARQTQLLLKQKSSKINTDYVRMLKAKTKKLHALSTNTQVKLTSDQKQKIAKVYKKIRTHLKQIDKINEEITKQKAIQKQKMYLQEKMTPKKIQKLQKQLISLDSQNPQSNSPNMGKKISAQEVVLSPKKKVSTEEVVITPKKVTNQQIIITPKKSQKKAQTINLLDMQVHEQANSPKNVKKISEPEQFQFDKNILDIEFREKSAIPKQKSDQIQIQVQHLGTPQKSSKKNIQNLIELDENGGKFNSPNVSVDSQKRLNFKQLYAINQLSPELKDLDLGTPQKLKSKQSIKSQQDAQFGEFS